MKTAYTILVLCLVIHGCNSDELQICKGIDNQNWLTSLIDQHRESTERVEFHSYVYRSRLVIAMEIVDNPCDVRNVIYDCSGKIICQLGCVGMINTCPDFSEEATNKKLIFKN